MKLIECGKKYPRILSAFLVGIFSMVLISTNSYASFIDSTKKKTITLNRDIESGYPHYEDGLFTIKASIIQKPSDSNHRKFNVTFYYDNDHISDVVKNDMPPMPLILFSSGSGGKISDYIKIISEIVSKGYVVAGIEHTYIDKSVVFNAGTVDEEEKTWDVYERLGGLSNLAKDYLTQHNAMEIAALDVTHFLADFFLETSVVTNMEVLVNEEWIEMRSVINKEHIGYAAHSLGGMTASLMIAEATSGEPNPYYEDKIKGIVSYGGLFLYHPNTDPRSD